MSTNETLMAVPLNVEEAGETRKFLVKLIEKVDVILGYRGSDPYVSSSGLTSITQSGLTTLENSIGQSLDAAIEFLTEAREEAINALKSDTFIDDADDSTQTISSPPTQAEVQSIQDQVVEIAEQLNKLLAVLRDAEIIAS